MASRGGSLLSFLMSKEIAVKALNRKYDQSYGIEASLHKESDAKNLAQKVRDPGAIQGEKFAFKVSSNHLKKSK